MESHRILNLRFAGYTPSGLVKAGAAARGDCNQARQAGLRISRRSGDAVRQILKRLPTLRPDSRTWRSRRFAMQTRRRLSLPWAWLNRYALDDFLGTIDIIPLIPSLNAVQIHKRQLTSVPFDVP